MKDRWTGTWRAAHGRAGDASWALPRLVTHCAEVNRADQNSTTLSHEYLDAPEVLRLKVERLAELVRESRCCVAYTGAGLSKSAGIPDYATQASNSAAGHAPKLRSNLDAQPTRAHHVLAAMHRAGFLHHYVQQNHDGLPQKAGFPLPSLRSRPSSPRKPRKWVSLVAPRTIPLSKCSTTTS